MVWSLEEEQTQAARLVSERAALLAAVGIVPSPHPSVRAEQLRTLLRAGAGGAYLLTRNRFVTENRGLSITTARRFGASLDLDELIAAADSGLLDAIDYWTPRPGIRFAAYAISWIRLRILQRLHSERRLHRIRAAIDHAAHIETTYEVDLELLVRRRRLAECLPLLAPRSRQLITALYVRGEGPVQAGAALGLHHRSIPRLRRRTLERLRRAMRSTA